MNHTLRALSAALVASASLALGGAVSTSWEATADEPVAKCPFISVADSSKAAMAVFTGDVTAVTKEDKPAGEPGAYFLQDVTVTRVYQGEIDTEAVQVRSEKTPKECSLGELEVGTSYMFFVVSAGDPWIAESGGGTVPADTEVVAKVEKLLGEGRDPVPPMPESAEFTKVETGEPDHALPGRRPRRRARPDRPARACRRAWPRPARLGQRQRYIPPESPGWGGWFWSSDRAWGTPMPGGSARRICSNCILAAICWA